MSLSYSSKVMPNLYISAMPKPEWDLNTDGFQLVVSLADHLSPQAANRFEWGTSGGAMGNGEMMFMHWPFQDGDLPDFKFLDFISNTLADAVRNDMKVLVHCYEGRNRAGLIAALTARKVLNISGPEAVKLVRDARPGMLYNKTFLKFVESL